MKPKNSYNHNGLKISLERALSVLGDDSREMLMSYMATRYGISFERGCSLAEIQSALEGVFGSGSSIITDRMYKELQNMME